MIKYSLKGVPCADEGNVSKGENMRFPVKAFYRWSLENKAPFPLNYEPIQKHGYTLVEAIVAIFGLREDEWSAHEEGYGCNTDPDIIYEFYNPLVSNCYQQFWQDLVSDYYDGVSTWRLGSATNITVPNPCNCLTTDTVRFSREDYSKYWDYLEEAGTVRGMAKPRWLIDGVSQRPRELALVERPTVESLTGWSAYEVDRVTAVPGLTDEDRLAVVKEFLEERNIPPEVAIGLITSDSPFYAPNLVAGIRGLQRGMDEMATITGAQRDKCIKKRMNLSSSFWDGAHRNKDQRESPTVKFIAEELKRLEVNQTKNTLIAIAETFTKKSK